MKNTLFTGKPLSMFCAIFAAFVFGLTTIAKAKELSNEELIYLSAFEQAEMIARGEISSESLVKAYLLRIKELDRKGAKVQALLSLNTNALAQAKQKDAQRLAGKPLGILHGIPILVKDNIETSELPTTAGSLALINNNNKRDAPIIARLKAEGAIILGKTNMSEWANFRDNSSISGWSAVGGQTRNPHSLDRSPCGSSSGSGAGIAARFAPLAIGTETNGSIICPATMNGIVGIKPTVGLLSRTHIVPISVTQDTAGPMAQSVKDAALMLGVMAGSDPLDAATKMADTHKQNYLVNLDKSIAGKRIGVLRSAQSKHPEIINAFKQAIEVLKTQGAIIVEIDSYERPKDFGEKSLKLLLIEFKHELNKYLASTNEQVATRKLSELISFNKVNSRELALFGQSLFIDAQKTNGYDEEYQQIVSYLRSETRQKGIDQFVNEYQLDLLVTPSQTPAFLIDAVYGDSFPGGFAGIGWMAAVAGYPHVTVPMGDMKGLPIGISFISTAFTEALLLNVAHQYEMASQISLPPSFTINSFDNSHTKKLMTPLQQ